MSAEPTSEGRRGGGRWLLVAAIAAIGILVVAVALLVNSTDRPSSGQLIPGAARAGKLDGKLSVFVRPNAEAKQPMPIEDAGALPVGAGSSMSMEVHLNQPAFIYLLWLDCEGQITPLYPWNTETLEVKDAHQAPPLRRATNVLFSPLQLGSGWKLGERSGMETVLLLARSTPLPEGTKLGPLLDPLPPPVKVREPEELVILGLDPGAKSVATLQGKSRGVEEEAKAADEALAALMLRLGEHFELIRAVRFAHLGE